MEGLEDLEAVVHHDHGREKARLALRLARGRHAGNAGTVVSLVLEFDFDKEFRLAVKVAIVFVKFIILVGGQRVEVGGIRVEAQREPVEKDTAQAGVAVKAGIDCGCAVEHRARREHPRHRVVLHHLALEARGGLGCHQCDPTDGAARRQNELVARFILVERIGKQRADALYRLRAAGRRDGLRLRNGVGALGDSRIHGVTPSSPMTFWSEVARAADARDIGDSEDTSTLPEMMYYQYSMMIWPVVLKPGTASRSVSGVENVEAMQVMSALAQATRLKVYRRLVDELPNGMAAGEIAREVEMSPNGMTSHFTILAAAGLVSSEKTGRTVLYSAETRPVEELSAFLADAVERGKKTHGRTSDS
ncbi:MAG: ArsR/SmtB family transcription factor [Janthinobacterium lividum]